MPWGQARALAGPLGHAYPATHVHWALVPPVLVVPVGQRAPVALAAPSGHQLPAVALQGPLQSAEVSSWGPVP